MPFILPILKVLESAGLLIRRTIGRIHLIKANLGPVKQIGNWFEKLRSIWDLRLHHLEKILHEENKNVRSES